jgi:GT2 family glycosyltransferase
VNWNSGDELRRAVRQLLSQVGVEMQVVVVDNGSIDGSADGLPHAGNLEVIRTGRNLGYAAGNNLGLVSASAGSMLLIMNPDVSLPGNDLVARLAAILDRSSELGAIAPTVVGADGTPEYTTTVAELRRARVFWGASGDWAPGAPEVVEMPWIDGAMMLVRREALDEVGPLDERLFLTNEEIDICERLRGRGWSAGVASRVQVDHIRSSSFGDSQKAVYYYWRNLYLVLRKHAPGWAWRFFWLARLVRYATLKENRDQGCWRQALRGGWDAVRGRYGPGAEDADSAT